MVEKLVEPKNKWIVLDINYLSKKLNELTIIKREKEK